MKIMFLLYSFTIGGTEKLVSDICNELSVDNEVHLFIVNDHYDKAMLSKLCPRVHVNLYGRKIGANNKISLMVHLYKYCKFNRIDIIHCNALNTPELLFLTKVLIKKVKIVYTIHGVGHYASLNKIRIFYRNLICDSIIAISKSVYNDIISQGADIKKTHIVFNAINLEHFNIEKVKSKHDVFIIGNIARIDPLKKGQDILLDALNLIKDKCNFECFFAGAPSKQHDIEFQKLKNRAKYDFVSCRSVVNFIGSTSDVPEFLKKIDLFILPSRSEGFGLSLVEAMCMEIPCISSDINGPREIVGNNERGFLFQSGSAEDLAEKILYVMNNYDEALLKAKIAKEYVKNNFNIKNMCRKLMMIYEGSM